MWIDALQNLQASGMTNSILQLLSKQGTPRQASTHPVSGIGPYREPLAPISINLSPSKTANEQSLPGNAQRMQQRAVHGWPPAHFQACGGDPSSVHSSSVGLDKQQPVDSSLGKMAEQLPEPAHHAMSAQVVHVSILRFNPPPPPPPVLPICPPSWLNARVAWKKAGSKSRLHVSICFEWQALHPFAGSPTREAPPWLKSEEI